MRREYEEARVVHSLCARVGSDVLQKSSECHVSQLLSCSSQSESEPLRTAGGCLSSRDAATFMQLVLHNSCCVCDCWMHGHQAASFRLDE